MKTELERRAAGVDRVMHRTTVEICAREDGATPSFEADCLDVSGRGMRVRAPYVPPIDTQLVLRFHHAGQEILAEAVVAWVVEAADGGELGLRFTALDRAGVGALQALCAGSAEAEPEPEAPAAAAKAPERLPVGSKVRLVVEGLAAPMRAKVRSGNDQRIRVGSRLDFLALGKGLTVEDGAQVRHAAEIEAVDVAIDPTSRIPELQITLRLPAAAASGERTPEPSTVDAAPRDQTPLRVRTSSSDVSVRRAALNQVLGENAPRSTRPPRVESQRAEELEHAEELEPEALDDAAPGLVARAGETARAMGSKLAGWTGTAAAGFGQALRFSVEQARGRMAARAANKDEAGEDEAPRPLRQQRVTASSAAVEKLRARPRRGAPSEPPATSEPTVPPPARGAGIAALLVENRKIVAPVAAVALLVTVGAVAMSGRGGPALSASARNTTSNAPIAAAAPAPAPSDDVTETDDSGEPLPAAPGPSASAKRAGVAPASPVAPTSSAAQTEDGIVADVPLFGKRTVTTPESSPAEPVGSVAAPAPAPGANDEEFAEDGAQAPSKLKPEDVKPFGRGDLKRPTVHRLRLDGPGAALAGEVSAHGFTAVIRGRKVVEAGSTIAKRDPRIAAVKTENLGEGAHISFRFRSAVPAYRVRLRKDFVEILVSEPEKAAKPAAKPHR